MSAPYREDSEHHAHDDGGVHPHISSVKLYVNIFLALIVCTLLTVAMSYVHLGPFNLLVAIVIATVKASLVVIFFMHLKDDSRFNALAFIGALLFGATFLVYTLNDTTHRAEVEDVQGGYVDPTSGEVAPGGMPNGPALRTDFGEAEEDSAEHEAADAPAAADHPAE